MSEVVTIDGRDYPRGMEPGVGDERADRVWQILDMLPRDALTMQQRMFLAGALFSGLECRTPLQDFLKLEMRVARYFNSERDEPAGRLISDLLIALRRTTR